MAPRFQKPPVVTPRKSNRLAGIAPDEHVQSTQPSVLPTSNIANGQEASATQITEPKNIAGLTPVVREKNTALFVDDPNKPTRFAIEKVSKILPLTARDKIKKLKNEDLAPSQHLQKLRENAQLPDANVDAIVKITNPSGREVYIVQDKSGPTILRAYGEFVDKIEGPNGEANIYSRLAEQYAASLQRPSNEDIQSQRQRPSYEDIQNRLHEYGKVIVASKDGWVLMLRVDEPPLIVAENSDDVRKAYNLLGNEDTTFTPDKHYSILEAISQKGKQHFHDNVEGLWDVDTDDSTIWLFKVKTETCHYLLRVSDEDKQKLDSRFHDDENTVRESVEGRSPRVSLRDPDESTQYTLHGRHYTRKWWLVQSEDHWWYAMSNADVVKSGKNIIDLDQNAGFNPSVDKLAIDTVKHAMGDFAKSEIDLRDCVAVGKTLTVIFDIKTDDKKKMAMDVRARGKYISTHYKGKRGGAAEQLKSPVEELFRMSVSDFKKLYFGAYDDAIEKAECGDDEEREWAKEHKPGAPERREMSRSSTVSTRRSTTSRSTTPGFGRSRETTPLSEAEVDTLKFLMAKASITDFY